MPQLGIEHTLFWAENNSAPIQWSKPLLIKKIWRQNEFHDKNSLNQGKSFPSFLKMYRSDYWTLLRRDHPWLQHAISGLQTVLNLTRTSGSKPEDFCHIFINFRALQLGHDRCGIINLKQVMRSFRIRGCIDGAWNMVTKGDGWSKNVESNFCSQTSGTIWSIVCLWFLEMFWGGLQFCNCYFLSA